MGRGFAGKLFVTMFFYEFRPIEPKPGAVGGSAGKIFAAMLLHYVIPYNFNMQHDQILNKLYSHLLTPGSEVGVRNCGQNICYHAVAFGILCNLICNMTMF